MSARKTLGWNVRALRVEKGLSQERLALEAGIDRSYVGRIERGTENVSIDMMEVLARALSVGVGDLLRAPRSSPDLPQGLRAGRKPGRA